MIYHVDANEIGWSEISGGFREFWFDYFATTRWKSWIVKCTKYGGFYTVCYIDLPV